MNASINIWIFALIVMIVCGLSSWRRKLNQMKILYRLGLILLLYTFWVLYGFSIKGLYYDSSSNNIEFNMVNSYISLISQTIGFSFFPYEGMGIVLPVF